jgi:predicted PurR-regulated permease PerM
LDSWFDIQVQNTTGGLLAWGFVGIFLGTTLLAVAYTVLLEWMEPPEPTG